MDHATIQPKRRRAVKIKTIEMLGIAALMLGACQQVSPPIAMPAVGKADMIPVQTSAPPKADDGKCWGKDMTPALVETVTEQVLVRPAGPVVGPSPDGAPTYKTVQSPAVYATQTQQKIITPRAVFWFEIPCPAQLNAGVIATLQRALKSRGLFRGVITGAMDQKTQKSVRWYQKQHGLDSTTLSLLAARQLGVIAYARTDSK